MSAADYEDDQFEDFSAEEPGGRGSRGSRGSRREEPRGSFKDEEVRDINYYTAVA